MKKCEQCGLPVLRTHVLGSWHGCVKESTPIAKHSWCVLPLLSKQTNGHHVARQCWAAMWCAAACSTAPCLLISYYLPGIGLCCSLSSTHSLWLDIWLLYHIGLQVWRVHLSEWMKSGHPILYSISTGQKSLRSGFVQGGNGLTIVSLLSLVWSSVQAFVYSGAQA